MSVVTFDIFSDQELLVGLESVYPNWCKHWWKENISAHRSEKVNKMFELAQSSKFPQSRYLQNLLAKTLVLSRALNHSTKSHSNFSTCPSMFPLLLSLPTSRNYFICNIKVERVNLTPALTYSTSLRFHLILVNLY